MIIIIPGKLWSRQLCIIYDRGQDWSSNEKNQSVLSSRRYHICAAEQKHFSKIQTTRETMEFVNADKDEKDSL